MIWFGFSCGAIRPTLLASSEQPCASMGKEIAAIERRLATILRDTSSCRAVAERPGVGLLTATAEVASIGEAKTFKSGREFTAWVGLVSRQRGTGGRVRQLGISKRGNVYLRTLLMHGARAVTRHEKFLLEMEAVVPWTRLLAVIDSVYPKAGNGRRPYDLSVMLRIHFMQYWFNYSDAAMEEALHDIPLLRRFAGLDAGTDTLPDETTILNFRHFLQTHRPSARLFAEVNGLLAEKGLLLREGTTVDATLIAAPPSTKNQDGKRDPEMTQTKKGNQWYFDMKAHKANDDSLSAACRRAERLGRLRKP